MAVKTRPACPVGRMRPPRHAHLPRMSRSCPLKLLRLPVCARPGRKWSWRTLNDPSHRDPDFACEDPEEHTSELQSLMRRSSAVFCLNKKITYEINNQQRN